MPGETTTDRQTLAETAEKLAHHHKDVAAMGGPGLAQSRVDFTRATTLTPEVEAEIDLAFEFQPWTDRQVAAGVNVRQVLAHAVKVIVMSVPPCPDRSAAIRKLREARMDANSAITHNGKY